MIVDKKKSNIVARFLYSIGVRPGLSMDIGDNRTSGYGHLDKNGFWQFPLYIMDNDEVESNK